MGKIPRKGAKLQKIAVESAHGFGDGVFNAALIKAISQKFNCKIGVAVRPHCKDAFYNLSFVSEIVEIPGMRHGEKILKKLGYDTIYQITQNIKFPIFKSKNPNHSLIDTPLLTGREIGIPNFDQRPIFKPTLKERQVGIECLRDKRPTIAIESIYKSAQSWAKKECFDKIINAYKDTHRILWLSNQDAPKHPSIDNMLRYTRRECIMCLQACDIFFSVGSGFFCASLAIITPPKKIVCLWTDNYYKYEKRLTELNWHPGIDWINNNQGLDNWLKTH